MPVVTNSLYFILFVQKSNWLVQLINLYCKLSYLWVITRKFPRFSLFGSIFGISW